MADGCWPIHDSTARPIYAGAPGKLKVVGFAGGGGSSVAVKLATGVDPDLCANHWLTAVLAHQRHFPNTEHACADIFDVDARTWRPGEKIAFGWFSPDCTDFSKAKGKAPRSERIRGLAWSIIPWALFRMIDTIMVENVEEILQWGPVYRTGPRKGEPIPDRRGETFKRWVSRLEAIGYVVEWRVLNAADYGAPTTRKRLYVIAKYVGWINLVWIKSGLAPSPIVWPAPTHAHRRKAAKLGLKPYRATWECIDWSEDCPSIFLTLAEIKAQGLRIKRPLASATQRRIARGIDKFVVRSSEPFIVPITQRGWGEGRVHGSGDPLPTILASSGGQHAAVDVTLEPAGPEPFVVPVTHQGDDRVYGGGDPIPTVTAAHRGEMAAVDIKVGHVIKFQENSIGSEPQEPLHTIMSGATRHGVVETSLQAGFQVPRYGEREGQAPRVIDLREAGPTVVPKGNGGDLAAISLQRQFGHSTGHAAQDPAGALMPGGGGKTAMLSAFLGRQFGSTVSGRDMADPAPTIMTEGAGGKLSAVTAFMAQGNHERVGRAATDPLTTITERATQQQLIAAHLGSYYATGIGSSAADPMRAATHQARHALHVAHIHQANTGMTGHAMIDALSTIVGKGSTQQLIETALEREGGPTGRRAAVLAFLWAHFGEPTAEEWADPIGTAEARLKFGLVILPAPDGPGSAVWMIVDIGLRMLKPRELAAAMGLPADYDLSIDAHGRPVSKTDQIAMIGNMVSPPPAEALIRANCPELIEPPEAMAA